MIFLFFYFLYFEEDKMLNKDDNIHKSEALKR